MKSIGIDIGSSSIKIVEISRSTKGYTVVRSAEIPVGVNAAYDQNLEIIEQLSQIGSSVDHKTQIVLGLNQTEIVARKKIFPFLDKRKIQKSLPFELEDEIPLNSEDTCFDFKVVQTANNQCEILAVAAQKEKIESKWRLANDCNLQNTILSAEGFALANLIENFGETPPVSKVPLDPDFRSNDESDETKKSKTESEPKNLEFFVHIGHSHTLVDTYRNRRLVHSRSILFGAKEVIQALSHQYELPFAEATEEFRKKAFLLLNQEGTTYDQVVFSDTLVNSLKPLVQELKLSLMEVESEFNGVVQHVWLSGGGSQIENFNAHLTQHLNRPVNPAQFAITLQGVEGNRDFQSRFAVATGLALEGLKKSFDPPINFFKGEFAPTNKRLQEIWVRWGGLLQVTAASFALIWIFTSVRLSQTELLVQESLDQLKRQARQTAGLSAKQAQESSIRKYLKDQKKRSDELKSLSQATRLLTAMDVLKILSQQMPSRDNLKVEIRSLKIEGKSVSLEGWVQQPQDLQKFEAGLSQVSQKPIQKITPTLGASQGVSFAYRIEVDRNPRGAM